MRSENFIESGNPLDEKAKSLVDALKSGGRLSPEIREALLKSLALPQQEPIPPSPMPQKEHNERNEDFVNHLTKNWFEISKKISSGETVPGIEAVHKNDLYTAVFHGQSKTWYIGPRKLGLVSRYLRGRFNSNNMPETIEAQTQWKLTKLAQLRCKTSRVDLPQDMVIVTPFEGQFDLYKGDFEFELGELEHTN